MFFSVKMRTITDVFFLCLITKIYVRKDKEHQVETGRLKIKYSEVGKRSNLKHQQKSKQLEVVKKMASCCWVIKLYIL